MNILRNAVEKKQQFLIDKLIKLGSYKKNDKHLFELTLSELEGEYKAVRNAKKNYHPN